MRIDNPQQWGPYAILVREAAFNTKEMGAWDYLKLPEIIDDICKKYQDEYGVSIREDVSVALKPCIVKFKSDYLDDDVIKAAIFYIYKKVHREKLSMDVHTFDARGKVIPRKDILKIDYLDKDFHFLL